MTMVLEKEPDEAVDAVHVVVAAGHAERREALRQTLAATLDDGAVREVSDLAALCRALDGGEPVDLVLLDLAMPSLGGFAGLLYLRTQHPALPVIVISAAAEPCVARCCLALGAAGFVPGAMHRTAVEDALSAVLAGGVWAPAAIDAGLPPGSAAADTLRRLRSLTPQQLRVLTLLARGLLNKQIAFELTVSEATVKAHVSAILQKLDVGSRTEAVAVVSAADEGSFGRHVGTA